jgi:hypothetical protein
MGQAPNTGVKMERHPYTSYETTRAWSVVEKAIDDLIANRDIKETTNRSYIVGYLVQQLVEKRVVSTEAVESSAEAPNQ